MRRALAAAVVGLALLGVTLDVSVDGVRDWLYRHPFSNGVLVGVLLISATYLVVERVLGARERQRWSDAAGPLLSAIATAATSTDRALRTHGPAASAECEWLAELLDRYQAVLTGTPELIARWHAALSLAQHARAVLADPSAMPDAEYEAAWERFRAAFADVRDFAAAPPPAGATWALPAVQPPS